MEKSKISIFFPPHPSTTSLASLPRVDTCLAAARSHSGENNTQLFSKTLVPLRYLKGKAIKCGANIGGLSIERTYFDKKIKLSVESSLKRVRGKAFF